MKKKPSRFHIPASELAGDDDPAEVFKSQIVKKANMEMVFQNFCHADFSVVFIFLSELA